MRKRKSFKKRTSVRSYKKRGRSSRKRRLTKYGSSRGGIRL